MAETIRKEDFADEKSRRIFEHRFNYFKTGSMEHILDMVTEEYYDFARRIDDLKKKLCIGLREFNGKLIIYGAGANAKLAMDFLKKMELDDKFACYCVSDVENARGGVKVIDDLCNEKEDHMVLVPDGVYSLEMIDNLVTHGWNSDHYVVIPYAILFDNEMDDKKDIKGIINNRDNHYIIYGTDWNSILFRNLMRGAGRHFDFSIAELAGMSIEDLSYVASMEDMYVVVFNGLRRKKALEAGVPEEKLIQISNLDEIQYFDEDVVPKHIKGKREVFVDGGSLNLYSSGAFMRWCNNECDKVIAFECDRRCVNICEDALEKMPMLREITQLVPRGLWSGETEQVFNEVDNYGSSSFVIGKGDGKEQVILTTSIDVVANGEPVTFIKMDIEGAELEALKGAQETIKKYRPTLAISIYHKPEDIVQLPQFIKSLVPEYKLYLRNYHLDCTETVLYAYVR